MTEDLFKSIKSSFQERTSSPLFGALALSWLAWNHRFFLILLSEKTIEQKFSYVDDVLYPDTWSELLFHALGPLATTSFVIFAYPFIAKPVFRFWGNRQRELREIRQQIEDATPLTVEESRLIRRSMIEMRTDYEKQLDQQRGEITNLKNLLANDERQIRALNDQLALEHAAERVSGPSSASDSDIHSAIMSTPYRLFYNPTSGKKASKLMLFGQKGEFLEGSNHNESKWRIADGRLEFLNSDNKIFSRFDFHPVSKIFTHTNQSGLLSKQGQYLLPEPKSS